MRKSPKTKTDSQNYGQDQLVKAISNLQSSSPYGSWKESTILCWGTGWQMAL